LLTKEEKAYMAGVGEKIKEIRKKAKLTQRDIYVRVGIPQNTISDYERGNRNPTLLQLLRLSEALGCEVWELLPYSPLM